MYYRLVAGTTRNHLVVHLADYLATAAADSDSPVHLSKPKSFEIASFVGGVVGLTGRNDFPALAIDAFDKTLSGTDDMGLFTYRYDGQITGMIAGSNAREVEQSAKAYAAAIEMFFRDHRYQPFADDFDASALPFSFVEMLWLRNEFYGATNLDVADEEEKGRNQRFWTDGFRTEIAWTTSEAGSGQHE